jgi:LAS superfamily LD-carboxypeptidase LdcB
MELKPLLLGLTEEHVCPWRDTSVRVHAGLVSDLDRMCKEAASAGIDLRPISGFRSFERQSAIWNAKATGQRALLADDGRPLDFKSLTSNEVIKAILRWSALPGASRHHWGTDMDVYDAAAVPPGYEVQLTPEESNTKFSVLHAWLDQNMRRFGFFRPYARDLGGIAPEAWHLSYEPLAGEYFAKYSFTWLQEAVRASQLVLKELVLENLPQIHEQYFLRISGPV